MHGTDLEQSKARQARSFGAVQKAASSFILSFVFFSSLASVLAAAAQAQRSCPHVYACVRVCVCCGHDGASM